MVLIIGYVSPPSISPLSMTARRERSLAGTFEAEAKGTSVPWEASRRKRWRGVIPAGRPLFGVGYGGSPEVL